MDWRLESGYVPTMRRVLPTALLGLSACFYPAERGRVIEARMDELAARSQALEERQRRSEESVAAMLPKIDGKIAEVSRALEGLDKAARRSDADIGVQLQKTLDDLSRLRGEVETYVYRIGELEAQLKKVSEETDRRLTELRTAEAARPAEAPRAPEQVKRPADRKEFLALADRKLEERQYEVARELYIEWLKKWPKQEGVAQAHFGLGRTYEAEDRCREALYEYGQLIQQYPRSKLAPEGLLRSAECFRKLKLTDDARLALEEIVRTYPKSEEAKAARARLSELNKKPPAKKGGGR